jgi:hypothetical protein
LLDEDEPSLCPAPGPDKLSSVRGRKYEDYVKSVVNPGNPTPSGFGYQLPNPEKFGKLVFYDDCEQATGTMIEAARNRDRAHARWRALDDRYRRAA